MKASLWKNRSLTQAVACTVENLEARRMFTAVPGRIQAEDYDSGGEGVAYHDTEAANLGGIYRADGVDLQATGDVGGGYNVGWTHAGEFLKYTVNAASAGNYDLAVRVANPSAGSSFHVEVDGVNVTGSLAVPVTADWQTYTTVTKSGIAVGAGNHVIRMVFDTNNAYGYAANVNWLQLTPSAAVGSTPFGGTPAAVPGQIEAENFDNGGQGVAYNDSEPANLGGAYRSTGVDLQATTDAGGGYNVGWTHTGEWLNYTINVASTATYDLGIRVANPGAGGAFHVEVDGLDVTGTLNIPTTADWQTYTTVTRGNIGLTAGQHTLRLYMDANSTYGFAGNFNWLKLTPSADTGSISGVVYYDTNGNGIRDLNDTGISGRQVYLDIGGYGSFRAGDPIATTDANGNYSFPFLSAANYIVRMIVRSGSTQTDPTTLYGGFYYIPLNSGTGVTDKNFGVVTAGLVAHYAFNEASGNAIDSVGGRNGTVIAGVTQGQPGILGNAYVFHGANNTAAGVLIPPSSNITDAFHRQWPLTMVAWTKTTQPSTSLSGEGMIINLNPAGVFDQDFTLAQVGSNADPGSHPGEASIRQRNGNATVAYSNQRLDDGAWHLLVAEFLADNTRKLFVDGKFVSGDSTLAPYLSSINQMSIGFNSRFIPVLPPFQSDEPYQGSIDDVGLWDQVLSNAQIALINGLARFAGADQASPGLTDAVNDFNAHAGSFIAGGLTWHFHTGLSGTTGDLGGSVGGGNAYIVLDNAGDGFSLN